MSDITTIKIEGVDSGWMRVYVDGAHHEYVKEVKVAGCDLELEYTSHAMTVTCTDYEVSRDSYPTLLIEAAEWYTPIGDTED